MKQHVWRCHMSQTHVWSCQSFWAIGTLIRLSELQITPWWLCMSNKFWFSLKTSFVDSISPQSVFCFSTLLFYEQEPGTYKKAPLRNAEFKQSHILAPVSGWHALVLQDVMQLLLFPRDGRISVDGEILPQTYFFFSPPVDVNRDVSMGLRQHENMVIVWLDFLKNISLRFTASVIRSWCQTPTHYRNNCSRCL